MLIRVICQAGSFIQACGWGKQQCQPAPSGHYLQVQTSPSDCLTQIDLDTVAHLPCVLTANTQSSETPRWKDRPHFQRARKGRRRDLRGRNVIILGFRKINLTASLNPMYSSQKQTKKDDIIFKALESEHCHKKIQHFKLLYNFVKIWHVNSGTPSTIRGKTNLTKSNIFETLCTQNPIYKYIDRLLKIINF